MTNQYESPYHPDMLLNICSGCFPLTLVIRHGVAVGFACKG